MTGRRHPTRAWLLALALSGPGAGSSTAAEAPVFESELHRFQVITVSRGLEHPWGLAFLPDGAMLVTERPGRLRLIRDGVLDPAPVPGTPEVYAAGQGGLLDVALHPDFATNRWVYLSYAGRGRDGAGTEVARGRFVDGRLEGLEHPWGLAFLPDGAMLVTERPGRLRLIRDGVLDPAPVPGTPEVYASGQGGLLDVALHPDFATNRWVYLSYAGRGRDGAGTEVARGRFVDGRLEGLERIFAVARKSGGGRHFGSRLVFGTDGTLYITAGERGDSGRAQDPRDAAGSVIRVTDSGAIPPDNPFLGRGDALPEIFSLGHRNPQGLARHPETGRIWAVEHGPRGGDELNLLHPGANYGWPVITHGESYAGFKIGEGPAKPGMEQPAAYWVPSISPSGLTFYTGDAFPRWRGSLFLGALSGEMLVRLELDREKVVHEERLLEDLETRIRDVRQGPDGRLYLLTDEADGALLRLDPLP